MRSGTTNPGSLFASSLRIDGQKPTRRRPVPPSQALVYGGQRQAGTVATEPSGLVGDTTGLNFFECPYSRWWIV